MQGGGMHATRPKDPTRGFVHEALIYEGIADFIRDTSAFVRDGLQNDEHVLVVVSGEKVELLRETLGEQPSLRFENMDEVGRNPARILPIWRSFADRLSANGVAFRGVGEPISSRRSADEIVECQRHEALLNLAFHDGPPWRLACPYDRNTLSHSVIEGAERSHGSILEADHQRRSETFQGWDSAARPLDAPLSPVPVGAEALGFSLDTLSTMRAVVEQAATSAGLPAVRVSDLVSGVSEVMANSVRHGGGTGLLTVWRSDRSLVCEVRDRGRFNLPFVGREQPLPDQLGGYGLWLANQLCDLVQIRSSIEGSVVRITMAVPP
jgi:anti-sigma regulatory factor (Ser/Thr protein kinase)